MAYTIVLSESVYSQLDREARRVRLSPNELADKLLAERLSAERQAWQQKFESLLARVHARMAHVNSAEIESDISAAAAEVKAERRAGHRSA